MPSLVDTLLSTLRGHPLVKDVRVVDMDESPSGSLELKIRCRIKKFQFQVWIHQEDDSLDYAFQLFSDHPLLRWDNSPHYPNISTAPNHFHDENGRVGESAMTGRPAKDIQLAMAEIEKWISLVG